MLPEMTRIDSHKDLIVWQRAVTLAGLVYGATRALPAEERHGLHGQLRRAAVSIASNIAEGAARKNRTEFLQHLYIARGSLSELETQLLIAVNQAFLTPQDAAISCVAEVGRLLHGLIASLKCTSRQAHANACSPDPPPQLASASCKPPTADRQPLLHRK